MSDFGLFEAATDAEQAPRRRERIAARQMSAALQDVHRTFEAWLANARDVDEFEDRWGSSRKTIASTMISHGVGAYPAVMREVHGSLKSAWYAKHADRIDEDHSDDPTKEPKDDKDRDTTINKDQYDKVKKGDPSVKDEVETNTGDGSDAEGKGWSDTTGKQSDPRHKDSRRRYAGEDNFEEEAGDSEDSNFTDGGDSGSDKTGRRRVAEDRDAPIQDLHEGRPVSDALLVPQDHNDPSNPETPGVQNNFTPGEDTGSDAPHREAMQLVADIYTDWAQSNGLRVASLNTLDVYAANGLHDDDYFLLASLIRKAEEDCECDEDEDTDGPAGPDTDTDGPPSDSGDDSDDDESDSGSSESSEGGSDSDSDSDSDDSEGGESDSDSDSGNPFADDSAPADGPADAGPPAPDAAGPPDAGPPTPEDGPPAGPPGPDPSAEAGPPELSGPPEAAGQEFTVPETPPQLPPDVQSQIPPDDTGGEQAVPPEVVDHILGLPPGTLEQLIAEELNGGGGAPPSGPPPQLAFRRRAAEDPTQAAGADPAAAAQPQMPAAPPAGSGSAGTIPPPGSASVAPPPPAMPLENQPAEDALLDTALQSVTQMIDTETQEYQQIIDPLTQALQAIQFAQQVEQAENPLDVTPPEGTVDTTPSAAPGGAQDLQSKAAAIANRYKLSGKGYNMLLEAMSRKHYEHVAEAIRTLPPELRPGIATHIGQMFREDNPRFNGDRWLESVGAITASRRPFVIRSRRAGGGRTAGETWKNTPQLDAFEFPGQGEQKENPRITDNMKINDLPKMKGAGLREAKGVLDKWDSWNKQQTEKGLNVGGQAEIDQFVSEEKIGPRATDKLKTTLGYNRKAASFFTRKVPGWRWDDHLAGYISKEARPFTCSCGNEIPTPSYGTCRCGKLWNSYAIGDGNHLAANSADMFITREIPVREDVIVANRKMVAGQFGTEGLGGVYAQDPHSPSYQDYGHSTKAEGWGTWPETMVRNKLKDSEGYRIPEHLLPTQERMSRTAADDRGYESFDPYGKGDTEWVEDKDRADADAPHAPGKNASTRIACWPGCHEDEAHAAKYHKDSDEKTGKVALAWDAAQVITAGLVGEPVTHVSDPSFQGIVRSVDPMKGTAWVSHPGGVHEMSIYDLQSSGQGPTGPSLKQRVRQHLLDRANRGRVAVAEGEWDQVDGTLRDKNGTPIGTKPTHMDRALGEAARGFFQQAAWHDEPSDGWVKYDDDDPARQSGPKKPPSTKLKGGDPKWHSREPAGKFKSTNPFGGN